VRRASMPEATVDEYADSGAPEDEVSGTPDVSLWPRVSGVAKADGKDAPANGPLGSRFAAYVRLHHATNVV